MSSGLGGVDLGKDFRDKIVRSLPDMNKVMNDKPMTNFTIDNSPDGSMMIDENSGSNNGSKNRDSGSSSRSNLAPGTGTSGTAPVPGNPVMPQGGFAPDSGDLPPPPPVFDGGQG